MTLADQVLQLKRDLDAIYKAGVADGGNNPPIRKKLIGNEEQTLNLTIEDNVIYEISAYPIINISIPESDYSAYLYITMPEVDNVLITLPESIKKAGDRLEYVTGGGRWEISMDSSLGTLILNAGKIKHE